METSNTILWGRASVYDGKQLGLLQSGLRSKRKRFPGVGKAGLRQVPKSKCHNPSWIASAGCGRSYYPVSVWRGLGAIHCACLLAVRKLFHE